MKHKPFIILFMLLSIVLLAGCWDSAELKDLDLVSAIGIDEGGDKVENRYRVTVQIINEAQIAGAPGQGGTSDAAPLRPFRLQEAPLRKHSEKLRQSHLRNFFFLMFNYW
ncbi:hypothetical protein [Peribacillus sp. V2I11]|uniref:Ger(x)C family spore germination protein n=1 Tax=Peribacillus sp. V2I11 TaxID=3042277 RepID=UPI002782ADD4|nr:hypothetical protein [Peribacillus sp. V2I11]MDQ0879408.1 hypothetical protein [Peribacillus sp. V2I11]